MMKILLVEDSHDKAAKIAASLEEAALPLAIKISTNVIDAKSELQAARFDLMLLDINLPKRASSPSERDGGLEILRWLTTRGASSRPTYVIGMTSFEESYDLASSSNRSLIWQIIKYDHNSEVWKNQLRQTIIDIHKEIGPPHLSDGMSYRSDILVVTALQDPELAAILDLPFNFKKLDIRHDASVYYGGELHDNGRTASIIAVHASDKGLSGAAIATSKGIMTFWPRYVYMTGIAAGVKGRASIGDVIFSDLTWDWGSGKIKTVKDQEVFVPAPYQRRLDETLSRNAKEFSADKLLMENIHSRCDLIKPKKTPKCAVGVTASGASVLQSQPAVQRVIDQHKDLLSIEMEAFSVMFAAQTSALPRPQVVVAKSISDAGDATKNNKYQQYASYVSAEVFSEFSRRYLMGHISPQN